MTRVICGNFGTNYSSLTGLLFGACGVFSIIAAGTRGSFLRVMSWGGIVILWSDRANHQSFMSKMVSCEFQALFHVTNSDQCELVLSRHQCTGKMLNYYARFSRKFANFYWKIFNINQAQFRCFTWNPWSNQHTNSFSRLSRHDWPGYGCYGRSLGILRQSSDLAAEYNTDRNGSAPTTVGTK